MKNIQLKQPDFQKIYASDLVTVIFFIVSIEIFIVVTAIFGGAR